MDYIKTTILDDYPVDWLIKLRHWEKKTSEIKIYKVDAGSSVYFLRTIHASNESDIEEANDLYEKLKKCEEETTHILKSINSMKAFGTLETLYECSDESLSLIINDEDPKTIIKYMKDVLDAMTVFEKNELQHLEINPKNIFIKDNMAKIVDLGRSLEFKNNASIYELNYWPPEANNPKKIIPGKMDVYSWGISLYQALTKISESNLTNERKLKAKSEKNHNVFTDKINDIKIEGDTDGSLKRWAVDVLTKSLKFKPSDRSTFEELNAIDCPIKGLQKSKEIIKKEDIKKQDVKKEEIEIKDIKKGNVSKEEIKKEDIMKKEIRKEETKKNKKKKEPEIEEIQKPITKSIYYFRFRYY